MRVLLLASHPVQWAAPLYRLYAADQRLELTVAYCMLHGVTPALDRDFGVEVKWDVPLLDGYKWILSRNWSVRPAPMQVMGLVNPGLWRIIRRGRFDVVVICGYRGISYWIAAVAARLSGCSVVLATDANSLESAKGHSWKSRIKAFFLPRLIQWFDAVLVPSTAAARFARDMGTKADNVFMAPYVVDNDFFLDGADRSDRHETRGHWAVPEDAFVALFCGKLVPWKRPQDLLLAAREIGGMYVVYAGDGPLRGELGDLARELGIEERVRFLGFENQTRLPAIYRAADVLVLPSAYEPFGLVVNEAFATGTPAIVSAACGSAGDLVHEGSTGFVVEAGKVDDLADRLHRLAADPALRAAMGERAQARVKEWGPAQNASAFADACLALATRARVN
ncbi:MAG: glycosyltransferase family 4 protein [Candidatus Dormibacteraceae bacterium]